MGTSATAPSAMLPCTMTRDQVEEWYDEIGSPYRRNYLELCEVLHDIPDPEKSKSPDMALRRMQEVLCKLLAAGVQEQRFSEQHAMNIYGYFDVYITTYGDQPKKVWRQKNGIVNLIISLVQRKEYV